MLDMCPILAIACITSGVDEINEEGIRRVFIRLRLAVKVNHVDMRHVAQVHMQARTEFETMFPTEFLCRVVEVEGRLPIRGQHRGE